MSGNKYTAALAERQRKVAHRDKLHADSIERSLIDLELQRDDEKLARSLPDGADLNLRSLLAYGGRAEFRALGSSLRSTAGGRPFGEVFLSTLANVAPLMKVAQVVETPTGGDMAFSFVSALPSAGDVVADGGAATSGDPTFGVAHTALSFKYLRTVLLSSEVVTDALSNLEEILAEMCAQVIAADVEADLLSGGGSTEAQGLLAGPSATTAASASTLVVDDLANALSNVAAAYQPTASILVSNGGYWQMRRATLGTSAAGGQTWPVTGDASLFGLPVYIDPGLTDPATGVRTALVGSFKHAYLVRTTPLQVSIDSGAHFDTDQLTLRVTMRADGRRLNTGAARAVVMA